MGKRVLWTLFNPGGCDRYFRTCLQWGLYPHILFVVWAIYSNAWPNRRIDAALDHLWALSARYPKPQSKSLGTKTVSFGRGFTVSQKRPGVTRQVQPKVESALKRQEPTTCVTNTHTNANAAGGRGLGSESYKRSTHRPVARVATTASPHQLPYRCIAQWGSKAIGHLHHPSVQVLAK